MTDIEFENALPKFYYARVDGYNRAELERKRFARQQTFLIMLSGGNMKKDFTEQAMMKILPLPGDEEETDDVIVITPELHEQMQRAHNKR